MKKDPNELNNLAQNPRYAPQLSRLEAWLSTARKDFGDPIDFDNLVPKEAAKPSAQSNLPPRNAADATVRAR